MKTFWVIVQNTCTVVGVICIGYFFLAGIFESSQSEPFNPHKVSQVQVPPQKPAWEKPKQEYRQMGPVEFHGQSGQVAPLRLPPWDEGFVPYAVWQAGQNPCRPNRPH